MGIDFKVNITRKIKINGKEYGSPEEVPEQFRQVVKDAMDQAGRTGGGGKINVNGVAYDGPEAMPPDVREIYEAALAKAREKARASGEELPAPTAGRATAPEGALTRRTLFVILLLAGIITLIFLKR